MLDCNEHGTFGERPITTYVNRRSREKIMMFVGNMDAMRYFNHHQQQFDDYPGARVVVAGSNDSTRWNVPPWARIIEAGPNSRMILMTDGIFREVGR